MRFSASNRDFNVSEMSNSDEKSEARTGLSSEMQSLRHPSSKDSPTVKSSKDKPRRKNLTTAERLRIINDFKHGVPDKYYSVNPNPRRPGEFIVRKRKTPIEYDIEQCEGLTTMNPKGESPNHKRNNSIPSIASDEGLTDSPLSKTPSQLLTESTPPHNPLAGTGTALNPLAGTEFFSMQSSLNANLQRELDALHEKFNKLDAKFRKERAARKNKVQADTPKAKTLQEKPARSRKSKSRALSPKGEARTGLSSESEPQEACSSDSHEYEYEYVDDPPETHQPAQTHLMMMSPFGLARRPNIDIRDF